MVGLYIHTSSGRMSQYALECWRSSSLRLVIRTRSCERPSIELTVKYPARYGGAEPCRHRNAKQQSLNCTRDGISSQCSLARISLAVMLTRTWGSRPRTCVSRPWPRTSRPRTWASRPRTWLKSLSQGRGLEDRWSLRTGKDYKDQDQGHITGLKTSRQFPEISKKVSRNLKSFHKLRKFPQQSFRKVTWKIWKNQKGRN